jgi:hypothetical protein
MARLVQSPISSCLVPGPNQSMWATKSRTMPCFRMRVRATKFFDVTQTEVYRALGRDRAGKLTEDEDCPAAATNVSHPIPS